MTHDQLPREMHNAMHRQPGGAINPPNPGPYHQAQAPGLSAASNPPHPNLNPQLHHAPTFQGAGHDPAALSPAQAQVLHAQAAVAQAATAQPVTIQPGGAGPLTGLRDGLTAPATTTNAAPDAVQVSHPATQSAPPQSMAPQPSAHGQGHAQMTAQAFQGTIQRPSFPAAPSKVLAEQRAKGGDGHIRQSDQVPAFETPMTTGPLLEGVYPAPNQTPPVPENTQRNTQENTQGRVQANSHANSMGGEARRSPRPRPRLQHMDPHMDPTLQAKLAGVGEPNLAEISGEHARAATAAGGAFWTFEAGRGTPQENRRHLPRALIASAILLLVGLLGFAAWSQFQARTQIIEPVFIAAPLGPERVVPENPGGIQIPDQGLGVLNPEIVTSEPNLNALTITTPAANIATSAPTDDAIIIEEQLPVNHTGANATTAAATPGNTTPADAILAEGISTEPLSAEPLSAESTPAAAVPSTGATSAATQTNLSDIIIPAPRPASVLLSSPQPTGQNASSLIVTTAPSGVFVQEGSYLSFETAQSAYAELQRRAGSRLSGINPLYHQVEVNGQTRYRLYLTGFATTTNAELLGGALGRNQDSWLVRGS